MLNVLFVLYVDLQDAPLQMFFMGTENSNRAPSLPLLIYQGYLQQIISPLSLNFVFEERTVSHPELLTEYFM